MLLKDIKEIEYKLLILEQNISKIEFNDYLIIENYLDILGKITTNYMKYFKKYSEEIPQNDEVKKILIDKNNELLETDIKIDINTKEITKILEKYQN